MGRDAYSKRHTVQECRSISTKHLNKNHFLNGTENKGVMNWNNNGIQFGSIGFEIFTFEDDGYIRFQYTHTDSNGKKIELDYVAILTTTPCFFGGHRWWFICPLITNEQPCRKRVGVLYLDKDQYFGCRHCLNLTYKSCKEHDKHVDKLCKEPELLSLYFQSNDLSKLMLAIKAQRKLLKGKNKLL